MFLLICLPNTPVGEDAPRSWLPGVILVYCRCTNSGIKVLPVLPRQILFSLSQTFSVMHACSTAMMSSRRWTQSTQCVTVKQSSGHLDVNERNPSFFPASSLLSMFPRPRRTIQFHPLNLHVARFMHLFMASYACTRWLSTFSGNCLRGQGDKEGKLPHHRIISWYRLCDDLTLHNLAECLLSLSSVCCQMKL